MKKGEYIAEFRPAPIKTGKRLSRRVEKAQATTRMKRLLAKTLAKRKNIAGIAHSTLSLLLGQKGQPISHAQLADASEQINKVLGHKEEEKKRLHAEDAATFMPAVELYKNDSVVRLYK